MIGCTKPQKSVDSRNEVDLMRNIDEVGLFSEIADTVTAVPLETTDECLLGDVMSIAVTDSLFVILDTQMQTVFAFDKNGKFRFQAGCRGEGPHEYLSATQIDVVPSTGDILIYDAMGQKVMFFDSQGKHLKNIHTDVWAYDFAYYEEGDCKGFLFVNNRERPEKSGILRQDLSTGEVRQLLPRGSEFCSNCAFEFNHIDGKVTVAAAPYDNDIYEVSCDTLKLTMGLEITPRPSDYEIENDDTMYNGSFMRTGFIDSPRFIMMSFWSDEHKFRQAIIEKNTGKYRIVTRGTNDISNLRFIKTFPLCVNGLGIALAAPDNPDDNPLLTFIHYKK